MLVFFFSSENVVSFHKYRQHWHPQTSQKNREITFWALEHSPLPTEPRQNDPKGWKPRGRPSPHPPRGHCSVLHGIFGNLSVTEGVSAGDSMCFLSHVGRWKIMDSVTPTRILTYSNGIIKYKNKINTVNNCYKKNIVFVGFFL